MVGACAVDLEYDSGGKAAGEEEGGGRQNMTAVGRLQGRRKGEGGREDRKVFLLCS